MLAVSPIHLVEIIPQLLRPMLWIVSMLNTLKEYKYRFLLY